MSTADRLRRLIEQVEQGGMVKNLWDVLFEARHEIAEVFDHKMAALLPEGTT